MKTYTEWSNPKRSLTHFLQPGDDVDAEMVDYFLQILPPAYYSYAPGAGIVQIGEIYDHTPDGQPLYLTVAEHEGAWRYTGICLRGQRQAWQEIS